MRSPTALALLLALAACTGSPPPDATGEEVFVQVCARCHGEDLAGGAGPAIGSGSNAASRPDEFLVQTIERGRGRMPSFSGTLSDDQIARVVEYLRMRQSE
ncbi:MAG: c-type cytochrome [Acidimicrobiia bacterium]